jgi:hypothetical protein
MRPSLLTCNHHNHTVSDKNNAKPLYINDKVELEFDEAIWYIFSSANLHTSLTILSRYLISKSGHSAVVSSQTASRWIAELTSIALETEVNGHTGILRWWVNMNKLRTFRFVFSPFRRFSVMIDPSIYDKPQTADVSIGRACNVI